MTVYCAIPPLDQSETRIGRGYGLGYNRARTAMDQMHGGFDFVGDAGTPVLAPLPGVVAAVSHDSGPGYVRALRGYGNAVVLEHRFSVPGLPNPFYTLYAHLRDAPALQIGQRLSTGSPIGFVGNTTNGQFAGMGAHLHFEVRRAPIVAYGSRRDTFDPAILWTAVGMDWLGARREAQRMVGGQLLLREGGPSDCRAGLQPTVAGLGDSRCPHGWMGGLWGGSCPHCRTGLGIAPPGYIDPASISLKGKYSTYGRSAGGYKTPPDPPDYKAVVPIVGKFDSAPAWVPWAIGGSVLAASGVIWWRSR